MEKLKFENMNLSDATLKAISDMGFEEASPIQSQAIPVVLEGRDIIGQAQTGTGKTAAFGIPIIEKCDFNDKSVQALVLCPTRELSIQVAEEIGKLAKYKKGLTVLPVYGGQPIDRQIRALKKGVQVVIGTPGRVMDHIRRKTLKLDNISMMVLDEADEMFDMGFRDDIAFVMDGLKEERQTIFFSATMAKEIVKFASRYQNDPEMIKVVNKELTVPRVEQAYFEVRPHMKTEILCRLIDIYNPKLTVVFCNTKRKVDDVIVELQSRGYFADGLHGDLKQGQRDNVMNKFRAGTIDILVATDVAARGIDVDEVDMVINYDIPQDDEYYVHRIGRTARAGREGRAFNFVVGRDIHKLKEIQRYTKTKIERRDIPTLKDIEETHISTLLDKIKAVVDSKELGKYEKIIESLLAEDYTSFDIAAGVLKLYMSESKLEGYKEIDSIDNEKKSNTGRDRDRSSNNRKRNKIDGDVSRIHINVGKTRGVSQRHILSAVLEETGIDKKDVGSIDLFDKFSFVEVPKSQEDMVIDNLDGKKIKGAKIRAEKAKPRRK